MNTKDFDEVAEQAFQEYQADLSKEKAVEDYRQQLLKAVEEIPSGQWERLKREGMEVLDMDALKRRLIDLLKAKDYMED